MPAARSMDVFPQERARAGVEEPHGDVVPLDVHASADPAGRSAGVRCCDFDVPIEVHGMRAVVVVPKRLGGERAERGLFFGKHHRDLSLGRAINAGVGSALLPAIKVGLRRRPGLKAQPAQRRLLREPNARLDFPCDRDRRRASADAPDRDAIGLEIRARRLPPNADVCLDAPQRPTEPPQRQDLLSLCVRSRRCSWRRRTAVVPRRANVSGTLRVVAGFQVVHQ